MEAQYLIRQATTEDRDGLSLLKFRSMQNLYKGYLPEKNLAKLSETYAEDVVDAWLEDGTCQVGVLDRGSSIDGYVVCQPDRELQGYGLILDAGASETLDSQGKHELTTWAVNNLRDHGLRYAHIWLLQDNLRGRFMYEAFGFKAQKELKQIQRADYTMAVRHYVYPLENESGRNG